MKKLFLLLFLTSNLSFALTGLKVGDRAPNISLKDTLGNEINLSNQKLPVVLIFYRGSWCPYCINQLKAVQTEVQNKLQGKAIIAAISVDKPIVAKRMKTKFNFSFKVLSDPKAESLKQFKIVNKLDDDLVKKYKSSYQIDVEADSGETHHMVAHPAVFIIKKGKVTYADVHTNYKDRTKNSDILKNI